MAKVGSGSVESKQHPGILDYFFALYGLLSTTGADRQLYELGSRKLVSLQLELVDLQSGLSGQLNSSAHDQSNGEGSLPQLEVGTRVYHDGRGSGRVIEIDLGDARRKPYHVQFDNGEVHAYSIASTTKLRAVPIPSDTSRIMATSSGPSVMSTSPSRSASRSARIVVTASNAAERVTGPSTSESRRHGLRPYASASFIRGGATVSNQPARAAPPFSFSKDKLPVVGGP